jgi:RimJ/RimL family protein N-acetyltransferase
VETPRLDLRPPREDDRARFVALFCDDDFMIFSGGVLDAEAAHARFDRMLENAAEIPFAKQPVIERSSGAILGYAGVDWFDFEGERRLEFGWRLVPDSRGKGYATEATRALLGIAGKTFRGEILAMIDPRNHPSANVARKVGFTFWKQAVVDGWLDDIFRCRIESSSQWRGRP